MLITLNSYSIINVVADVFRKHESVTLHVNFFIMNDYQNLDFRFKGTGIFHDVTSADCHQQPTKKWYQYNLTFLSLPFLMCD